jgi:O-antigen ligase
LALIGASAAILWLFASLAAVGAVVLAAGATMVLWSLVGVGRLRPWLLGVLGAGCWLGAHVAITLTVLDTDWMRNALNDLSTGRLYMWIVALDVFLENPVFGAGPQSWQDNLLAGASFLGQDAARYEQVLGGAYHNVLFTTLAERGVVGTAALLVFVAMILALCARALRTYSFQLASRCSPVNVGAINPVAVVLVVLITLVRGVAEYSGPIAYANAHADFIALTIVALLLVIQRTYAEGGSATGKSGRSLLIQTPLAATPR